MLKAGLIILSIEKLKICFKKKNGFYYKKKNIWNPTIKKRMNK